MLARIKENISYLYYNNIFCPIDNFITGISNIISWIPLLYKDRPWDNYYLNLMIIKKIEIMRNSFIECKHHNHSKKKLRGMSKAINALKRISLNGYSDKLWDDYFKKWGGMDIGNGIFINKKIKSDEDRNMSRGEIKKIQDNDDYMINQDMELFSKVFKKSLDWWC